MKQLYGKAQWSEPQCFEPMEMRSAKRVLLDGREIQLVTFVDTSAGIVKTLDVHLDGVPKEIDYSRDGVLTETLRGKVEVFDE